MTDKRALKVNTNGREILVFSLFDNMSSARVSWILYFFELTRQPHTGIFAGMLACRRSVGPLGSRDFRIARIVCVFSKHEYPFDSVTSVWNLEPLRCANET